MEHLTNEIVERNLNYGQAGFFNYVQLTVFGKALFCNKGYCSLNSSLMFHVFNMDLGFVLSNKRNAPLVIKQERVDLSSALLQVISTVIMSNTCTLTLLSFCLQQNNRIERILLTVWRRLKQIFETSTPLRLFLNDSIKILCQGEKL
uniref:Uncharacterized protein n=1 Tax=Glossina pallidipes TaxID=7398 RepID=A0A1B0AE09_GLOPL